MDSVYFIITIQVVLFTRLAQLRFDVEGPFNFKALGTHAVVSQPVIMVFPTNRKHHTKVRFSWKIHVSLKPEGLIPAVVTLTSTAMHEKRVQFYLDDKQGGKGRGGGGSSGTFPPYAYHTG